MRKVDIYISHREYTQDGRWITLHPHGNNNGEKDYKRVFIDDDGTIEKGVLKGKNIKDLGKGADGEKKKGKSSDSDKQSEKPKARLFKPDELSRLEKSFRAFRLSSTRVDKIESTTKVFERLPVGTEIAATLGSGRAAILRKTAIDENGKGEWHIYEDTGTGELRKLFGGSAFDTESIATLSLDSPYDAKFSYRDRLPNPKEAKKGATTKPAIAPKSTATPQSLKNYDKKSKQFNEEERKRRKGGVTEEQAKEVSKEITRIIENSDFCMDRQLNTLEAILDSGRFMNLFETGTSGGSTSKQLRSRVESTMFGIKNDIDAILPRERPKYGYMRGRNSTSKADDTWYGGVTFVFKRDVVMPTATYTFGDSLDHYLGTGIVAGRVTKPSLAGLDSVGCGGGDHCEIEKTLKDLRNYKDASDFRKKNGWLDGYLEVQYHGELTLDAIETVMLPKRTPKRITERLDKLGIRYIYK